jgi:hypothetical protein
LSNNNANLRRMKEWLAGVEKVQATHGTVHEGMAARLLG